MIGSQKIYATHCHILNGRTIKSKVLFKKLGLPGSSLVPLAIGAKELGPLKSSLEKAIKLYKKLPYFDIDYILDMFQENTIDYVKLMIREMDEAGIDRAFALMIPQDNQKDQDLAEIEMDDIYNSDHWDRIINFYGWSFSKKVHNDPTMTYGCKVYPALHKITESTMDEMFSQASEDEIPIVIHCSSGGIGRYKKQNHPKFWAEMIYNHPDVNVCFAHGGGEFTSWTRYIVDLIVKNEMSNVFIDFAFHNNIIKNPGKWGAKATELISEIPGNVMGGPSDFPLGTTLGSMADWHTNLKKAIGEYNYVKCNGENPERFMKW